jgi:hypothetical protein
MTLPLLDNRFSLSFLCKTRTVRTKVFEMVKRTNLKGPWECSWCGLKDYDPDKIIEHEKSVHLDNKK